MWSSVTKESRFVHAECDATLFQDTYKRNNKSSGSKHLRCFPHCCKSHNATGYCGSTLHVATTSQEKDLLVFAKFCLESDAFMHVGKVVKREIFESGDYLQGSRDDSPSMAGSGQVFEINSKRNSWHYGWVSSRFVKSTVLHQMKVFFVMPIDNEGSVYCVDILSSRSFKIESTRTGTKHMAKMNQAAKTEPSIPSPSSSSKKRPHLVLETTEYTEARSSVRHHPASVSPQISRTMPTISPQTMPPPHAFVSLPKQPMYMAFPPRAPQPPPPPTYDVVKGPSFMYPGVNNLANELVLGNGDFLDSLITAMEDEDDATPRP